MSFNAGEIYYDIGIKDREYARALKRMESDADRVTGSIAGKFTKMAAAIGAGAMFVKAMGNARAFSRELANVQSIADDLDMRKVREEILNLNATLGETPALTNALYFAYSAGVRGTEKELVTFTGQVAKLAQTVGSDVTPVMDAVTTLMNAYNLKIRDTGRLMDWFYQVVKSGKTTGPALAQSLGMIASSAASAKIPLEQLGAGIATLTTTMPTSQAITSLNQAIMAFIKPTQEASETAAQYGFSMSAAALEQKGFIGMLEEIREKTGGNVAVMAKLFTSVEALKAALALGGTQYEAFNQVLKDFGNNAGAAERGFSAIARSDNKKWEAMLVVLKKIGTVLGDMTFQVLTLGGALDPLYEKLYSLDSESLKRIANIAALTSVILILRKAYTLLNTAMSWASVQAATQGTALFHLRAGIRGAASSAGILAKANYLLAASFRALNIGPAGIFLAAIAGPLYLIRKEAAATGNELQKLIAKTENAKIRLSESERERQQAETTRAEDMGKVNRLEELSKKNNLNANELREAGRLIQDLKKHYGEFGLTIDKTTGKIISQTEALKKYRDQIRKSLLEKLKAEEADIETTIQSRTAAIRHEYQFGHSKDSEIQGEFEKVKKEYEAQNNNGKKIVMRVGNERLFAELRQQAIQNLIDRELNSGEIAELKKRLDNNRERQSEAKDDSDLRMLESEKRKQELGNAKEKINELQRKWGNDDLTEHDKKAKEIRKEYEDYKKALDVRLREKDIEKQNYDTLLKQAQIRRDMKINANDIDEENSIALLKKQVEALRDGIISNEEKLGFKQAEIEAAERRIAELRKQYSSTKSEEARKKITAEIAKEELAMAEAKAEKDRLSLEMKKQEGELQRKTVYNRTKEALSNDGVLSENDEIVLKRLEIEQEMERLQDSVLQKTEARSKEERQQAEYAEAETKARINGLKNELRVMEQKKRLGDAEKNANRKITEMEIKASMDGYVSKAEEREILREKITQQKARIKRLADEIASSPAELKQEAQDAVMNAKRELGSLMVEQRRMDGATRSQNGSFYGSVLSAITGNPIEEKKVGLLEKIDDSNRKILEKGSKITFK